MRGKTACRVSALLECFPYHVSASLSCCKSLVAIHPLALSCRYRSVRPTPIVQFVGCYLIDQQFLCPVGPRLGDMKGVWLSRN